MRRKCFVIGPMSGGIPCAGSRRTSSKKLLPDWEVATPDSSEIGNVMKHVIKSCDRAQLVIANTNGNNPNVLYEMALLDALGRACIPVKIIGSQENDAGSDEAGLMPFDLAAYRLFEIH